MAFDQTHMPSTEPEITLVDIEELRKMLGAEADIASDSDNDPIVVRASTVMCEKYPWQPR